MKLCFITALTGNYEIKLREPVKQSVPCDFIAFTEGFVTSDSWTTYPLAHHPSYLKTPYDIAKWYKLQFYKIDFLKPYDYVVWVDGSIELTNENIAKSIIDKGNLCSIYSHEWRNGLLINEALGMRYNRRYDNEQPLFIMDKFYNQGYKETFFKLREGSSPNYGVFITCFVAWKQCELLNDFFDDWWTLHLSGSKNDQLTFSFILWKHSLFPYEMNQLTDKPHVKTTLYIKHQHGS